MPNKRHDRILKDSRRLDVLDLAQLTSLSVEQVADDLDVVADVGRVLEDLDVSPYVGFEVSCGGGAV